MTKSIVETGATMTSSRQRCSESATLTRWR
nr:MAG TPA: hypothetical protein [Caudoviricetes sp.]